MERDPVERGYKLLQKVSQKICDKLEINHKPTEREKAVYVHLIRELPLRSMDDLYTRMDVEERVMIVYEQANIPYPFPKELLFDKEREASRVKSNCPGPESREFLSSMSSEDFENFCLDLFRPDRIIERDIDDLCYAGSGLSHFEQTVEKQLGE